jgi:CRP/FNR family cyclic AMP-dependent transcriptional regulator
MEAERRLTIGALGRTMGCDDGTSLEGHVALTAHEKSELLDRVDLFKGLGGVPLSAVADRAVEVEFPSGRAIARQGEVGTGFFLIVSGAAHVTRDGELIAVLGPGDFFGELSLLDQGPRVATVTADGPTVCLAIASWDFERLLEEQPRVAIALLRGVAGRLRDVTDQHRH